MPPQEFQHVGGTRNGGPKPHTARPCLRLNLRLYEGAAAALNKRGDKEALEYLIGAAVRHQSQRPTLARLLNVEESRPELRHEAAQPETFRSLLLTIIKRTRQGHRHPEVAAFDIFAMMRGMVDAAGQRGERDIEDMERRVRAAVFGYLSRTGMG